MLNLSKTLATTWDPSILWHLRVDTTKWPTTRQETCSPRARPWFTNAMGSHLDNTRFRSVSRPSKGGQQASSTSPPERRESSSTIWRSPSSRLPSNSNWSTGGKSHCGKPGWCHRSWWSLRLKLLPAVASARASRLLQCTLRRMGTLLVN